MYHNDCKQRVVYTAVNLHRLEVQRLIHHYQLSGQSKLTE